MDVVGAEPVPEVIWRELQPVLDAEVQRLPDRYRAPFVLCYLEGKTNEEAARQLGCPKGTVLSRLARARERLRARLTRRGLTLTGGLLAAALAHGTAAAQVPAALAGAGVQAALAFATGRAAGVSPEVLRLAEGVLRAMFRTRLQFVLASLLAVALLGGLAVVMWYRAYGGQRSPDDRERLQGTWQATAVERAGPQPPDDYVKSMRLTFQGDRVRLGPPERRQEGTFRLDTKQTPRTIDLIISERERLEGIYQLEKEALKLCLAKPGEPRPTEFAGKGEQMFITFKRAADQ
jgi:uncharacterized protein (TIGR03067 family)